MDDIEFVQSVCQILMIFLKYDQYRSHTCGMTGGGNGKQERTIYTLCKRSREVNHREL